MAQLICKELSLGYDKQVVAWDINMTVNEGDYVCIVGDNGSGKTTLLKTLLGFNAPISGEICFGDGVTKNTIGYLPQQTDVQKDFPASAREIILSGTLADGKFRPFYTKEQKKRADQVMEKLGITDLADKCFRELSGGQRQRILLARAILTAKKMIILDEPVSGLDPKSMLDMYKLIKQLNKEDNMTILMITHDTNAAIKYASHVLCVGKPNFFGTRDEFAARGYGGKWYQMTTKNNQE